MNEFERIADIFAPFANGVKEAAGLRDDAAFISAGNQGCWVITTDAISEGIHFLPDTAPDLIARKLLRTNLSDLAAKGAKPEFYLLNIMLPAHIDDAWIRRFADGLMYDQQQFGVSLIGGDSIAVKGMHASFSITAFGKAEKPIKRSGARAGDVVAISGVLGEAAIGLALENGRIIQDLTVAKQDYYKNRYALPEPRLRLGQALVGMARSCMDISDGLVQDAGHMARASSARMVLNFSSIPTAPCISAKEAITHGDDYELLFTLPEARWGELCNIAQEINIPVTRVGRVETGEGVSVLDDAGQSMVFEKTGWQH